ncbi:MAG: hypothetical protein KC917_07665 [Candidatus Omnitrophica bacterium]|nr:hypothetical protein [Candidatus Omnitrophota bacterium]MCA9416130.1 hypothetical protein [Candidatus Omnitrophota bacterium]MCA9423898.1 hypothetical protein [Candidatus Omnitrophota bacterium]MCA9437345.1 hypothetical protein [Candidatus Omnitrophota bacterium]MCA9440162.1 hypothetical protein [Candidatus Omnitrophota bacterium]
MFQKLRLLDCPRRLGSAPGLILLILLLFGARPFRVEATPMKLTDDSIFQPGDYFLDFERINTDVDGTVFNGLTEDLRDRQWLTTEFQNQFGISFDSSIELSTSTHKPNESGTYRGATATDYPRDVFYAWASSGMFGPSTTTYSPSTGSWGYGALSNFNTENMNGGWIDIKFDNPITRFGLNFITGASALRVLVNGQTFDFGNTYPWDLNRFAGIIDVSGFQEIRVSALGGGAFLVDNFQYERHNEVPEPATLTLLTLGGALLARSRGRFPRIQSKSDEV